VNDHRPRSHFGLKDDDNVWWVVPSDSRRTWCFGPADEIIPLMERFIQTVGCEDAVEEQLKVASDESLRRRLRRH
jgi:hypothetical protein